MPFLSAPAPAAVPRRGEMTCLAWVWAKDISCEMHHNQYANEPCYRDSKAIVYLKSESPHGRQAQQ